MKRSGGDKTAPKRLKSTGSKKGSTTSSAVDDEAVQTKAMLDEIRSLLTPQAAQAPGYSKGNSRRKCADPHPAKDNGGPSPYDVPTALVESFQRAATIKAKKKAKTGGPKKVSNEDLLGHYLSNPLPTVNFTETEMKEKVVNAPYTDTIVLVEQRLWMETYLEKHRDALAEVSTGGARETKESSSSSDEFASGNSSSLLSPSQLLEESRKREHRLIIEKLTKRFPRLCKSIKLAKDFDLSSITLRTDIWMVKLMEVRALYVNYAGVIFRCLKLWLYLCGLYCCHIPYLVVH